MSADNHQNKNNNSWYWRVARDATPVSAAETTTTPHSSKANPPKPSGWYWQLARESTPAASDTLVNRSPVAVRSNRENNGEPWKSCSDSTSNWYWRLLADNERHLNGTPTTTIAAEISDATGSPQPVQAKTKRRYWFVF
jgi:hypothetical protein